STTRSRGNGSSSSLVMPGGSRSTSAVPRCTRCRTSGTAAPRSCSTSSAGISSGAGTTSSSSATSPTPRPRALPAQARRATRSTEPHVQQRYESAYWAQMDRLGARRTDSLPRAPAYIDRMVKLLGELVDSGRAYVVEGQGVYFDVMSFPEYGELAHRRLDDLLQSAGARVDVDERKRNPVDFALWKTAKPGEPAWDSPWGKGRPGWHIECSTMSLDLLGEGFDIHGGGDDLVFPHHENERAQAQGAGHRFARYWIHNGMVMVGAEKMAKSLGNFTTLHDAVDAHGPRAMRMAV